MKFIKQALRLGIRDVEGFGLESLGSRVLNNSGWVMHKTCLYIMSLQEHAKPLSKNALRQENSQLLQRLKLTFKPLYRP